MEKTEIFYINYFSSMVLYFLILLFYKFHFFYLDFIKDLSYTIMVILFLLYLIFYPIYYFFIEKEYKFNKNYLFLVLIKKYFFSFLKGVKLENISKNKEIVKFASNDLNILLGFVLKFFFVPLILNFLIGNIDYIYSQYLILIENFNWYKFYFVLLASLYVMDLVPFVFGYLFESKVLKNEIKSVDKTFSGWFFCLICYPPFVYMSNNFFFPNLNLDYHDYSFFWINIIMMFLVFILLFIYSSASVSLGFKASNLTNRGIVKNKTYSLIRHPAYSTKVLMWWFMIIPIINLQILFSMLVLSFVYYMRAITEERHLLQDPDYIEYCKKVKSRFIPGIW